MVVKFLFRSRSADRAGDNLSEAADDAKHSGRKTLDKMGDAADDAKRNVERGVDDIKRS